MACHSGYSQTEVINAPLPIASTAGLSSSNAIRASWLYIK